jgi:hypothetical protein
MKNKPNLPKCSNKRNLSQNKALRKSPAYQPTKQTQFPERRNICNLSHNNGLRNQIPLYEKRNTNYAKQTQFSECSNERNHNQRKDLWEFPAYQPPKKQTQSNPIKPNFKPNQTQKQTQTNLISNPPAHPLPSIRPLLTAFFESGLSPKFGTIIGVVDSFRRFELMLIILINLTIRKVDFQDMFDILFEKRISGLAERRDTMLYGIAGLV